jgi:hypothetical protein
MPIDQLLFEVRRPSDGHKWLIYEGGRLEGFPEDARLIINHHIALLGRAVSKARIELKQSYSEANGMPSGQQFPANAATSDSRGAGHSAPS